MNKRVLNGAQALAAEVFNAFSAQRLCAVGEGAEEMGSPATPWYLSLQSKTGVQSARGTWRPGGPGDLSREASRWLETHPVGAKWAGPWLPQEGP